MPDRRLLLHLAAAVVAGIAALALALDLVDQPRRDALRVLPDALRVVLAALALFGLTGLGVTRLALPAALRPREWLWVLPVGACVTGLALTVLGFLGVPFTAAVIAVVTAGAALSAQQGWRGRPTAPGAEGALVLWLAALACAVALLPMLGQHFATVTGTGSDAHLAAGTAELLQHVGPTGRDDTLPVDAMPVLWRSKYPIYYAFAAVAAISGLETWQVLTTLQGLLLGLGAIGMFLLARDGLRTTAWLAIGALLLGGVDRIVLHTVLNPYVNQAWGWMALPFALVLGLAVARSPSRGGFVLLGLMLALLGFAYPLALPLALLPTLVALGPRRPSWPVVGALAALAAVLALPLLGVIEKVVTAALVVLDPRASLEPWRGDLATGFIAFGDFINVPAGWWWSGLANIAVLVFAWRGLSKQDERGLRRGLGAVLVLAFAGAVMFRLRDFGWYFHFKLLAFTAPLMIVAALAGVARLRRAGPVLLVLMAAGWAWSVRAEVAETGYQLGRHHTDLAVWAAALPPGASVRLDTTPPEQLWSAYFLAARPVCSQLPLLGVDYPRVAYARRADYAVVGYDQPRSADLAGPPLERNAVFALHRLKPGLEELPNAEGCSQRQVRRIERVSYR